MSNMTPEQQAAKKYPWLMNETVGNAKIEHKREAYADCIREKVEPLGEQLEKKTAENVKLRALVQDLVDACHGATDLETQTAHQEKTLAIAKQAGFVPTNTQDNG